MGRTSVTGRLNFCHFFFLSSVVPLSVSSLFSIYLFAFHANRQDTHASTFRTKNGRESAQRWQEREHDEIQLTLHNVTAIKLSVSDWFRSITRSSLPNDVSAAAGAVLYAFSRLRLTFV